MTGRLTPGPGDKLPLILVTPTLRMAQRYCRQFEVNPNDRRQVKVILEADALRGMGPGRDIVVLNPGGPGWEWRRWRGVERNLRYIREIQKPKSYRELLG